MTKIKLKDLIDAIEECSEFCESFFNFETGEICIITEEAINIASDDVKDYPDWQKEEIKIAKQYLENPEDYLPLPSQHEVNEYQMMQDFAENLQDEKIAGQLLIALRGAGAFRRFKDSVILLGLEKEWYKFREKEYKKFILAWCEENNLFLEENSPIYN